MYRLVRTFARGQNGFCFGTKKETPHTPSSSINLDEIPNEYQALDVDQPKKKKGIDLESVEDTFVYDNEHKTPKYRRERDGDRGRDGLSEYSRENEEDQDENFLTATDESAEEGTTEEELFDEAFDQYLQRLEKNGYDVKDYDKKMFYEQIRLERKGYQKDHLPYIEELLHSEDDEIVDIMPFAEFKESVPALDNTRGFKRDKEEEKEQMGYLELLNNPYDEMKPEEIERVKHGEGVNKGKVSFFLNPNTKSIRSRKEGVSQVAGFQSQNHKELIESLAQHPGKEDKLLAQFVDRFASKLSVYYLSTLREGYRAGLISSTRLSAYRNILKSLGKAQESISKDQFNSLSNFLFNSLLKELDQNYSELVVEKVKLFIPLIDINAYFSKVISLLAKYQNTTLLPELAESHSDLLLTAQVPDIDFNKLLIQLYKFQPISKVMKVVLARSDDSDYESFRAEVFRQRVSGKEIFKATEKEIESAYNEVKRQKKSVYPLYVILEIAQLNSCHQVIFDAYNIALTNPYYTSPVIQRFYHDSILILPISNLQDIVVNLIQKENCNLAFSLKALIKAGFYEEAWMIFKEKVIDEAAPGVMTERIRTFFRVLYNDYHTSSGGDITSLLKQSERFAESIKGHENYLIDIYNKENVYNRRFEERRGYFKNLFAYHPTLSETEFTLEHAEMLYDLILKDLEIIPWDLKVSQEILDHEFNNVIEMSIKDFMPLKEYMESVSDYQYKKEWELYLMQLTIYLEQLRTRSDLIDPEEFAAFQNNANPMIQFVLSQYELYPLTESKDISTDEMLLAITEVRQNNYWLRKLTYIDRRIMEENKFINEEEVRLSADQENVEDEEELDERLDRFDDMDVGHVFSKEPIVMEEGVYQKIETIKSVLESPEIYSDPRITGEAVYQLQPGEEGVEVQNAEQGNEVEGQVNAESVQSAPEQAVEEVAAEQAVEGEQNAQYQQQYHQQPQLTLQQLTQNRNRVQEQFRKAELDALEYQQLYRLGALVKDSSHYKEMIQNIKRPIIKHQVQSKIEATNVFGEDNHLLQSETSYHLKRFQEEDDTESELGLYEKKIDLDFIKPEEYQKIHKDLEAVITAATLYSNQDLEHVENMPEESQEMDQLEDDIINYQLEREGLDEEMESAEEFDPVLEEKIRREFAAPDVQGYEGGQYELPEEEQEANYEEAVEEVAEEAAEEAVEEAGQQGVVQEGQEEVAEAGEEDINIDGEYYEGEGEGQGPRYAVLENEYGVTNYAHALRLQYFRIAKVHKMWNNPLVDKHLKLYQFSEGLTRDTHIITIDHFEKLKNQFPAFWNQSESVMSIKPEPLVQELISWGIVNEEPMAIYMGEKLAMLTRQIIPDHLAENVSKLLNIHEDTPQHIQQKARLALGHVGKIERGKIYDFGKNYKHVISNKEFESFLTTIDKVHEFPNKDTIFRLMAKDIRQFAPGTISDSAAWKRLERRAFKKQCDYI